MNSIFVQTLKNFRFRFILASALLIPLLLGLYHYTNSQGYIVYLGDRELGIVEDAEELESFVADLTARCSALYGLDLELAEEIIMVKQQFTPEARDADFIHGKIRQHASFVTEAYMIRVGGTPFVPIQSEDALDEVVDSLIAQYSGRDDDARLLDVQLSEELNLEKCSVPLEEVLSPEEVAGLLTASEEEQTLQFVAAAEPSMRNFLISRHAQEQTSGGGAFSQPGITAGASSEESGSGTVSVSSGASNNNEDGTGGEEISESYKENDSGAVNSVRSNESNSGSDDNSGSVNNSGSESSAPHNPAPEGQSAGLKISVTLVEEVTINETMPFPVEQIIDEEKPVGETEVSEAGVEGLKKVVYRVVRENGEEIERTVQSEEILEEPRAQIEIVGSYEEPQQKQTVRHEVLSARGLGSGSGSFVWPVQGRGTIYNGFSGRHTGVDIHIDHGTPVLAADAGVVTFNGYGGTQGNYLIIHHGAYWTLYLHNSVNLVSAGERVSRGQVIGKVGATGRAFGAHLHFEIRVDDGTGQWHSYYQHEPIDPMQFFNR